MSSTGDSSSIGTYIPPKTRQRIRKPAPVLEVPHIEEDATERKRVLNVLAQRRYRERRRQNRNATAKQQSPSSGSSHSSGSNPDREPHVDSTDPASSVSGPTPPEPAAVLGPAPGMLTSQLTSTAPHMPLTLPLPPAQDESTTLPNVGLDLDFGLDWTEPSITSSFITGTATPPSTTEGGSTWTAPPPSNNFQATIDPSYLIDSAKSPSNTGSGGGGTWASDSGFESPSTFDFPDSYHFPVHELTLLRAFLRIATRLGCCSAEVWSGTALSPFCTSTTGGGGGGGGTAAAVDRLPETWRPTTTQVLVPHHPLLDFLPWPSARDKLIAVFSLPVEGRPEAARGPLALYNLAYDMEDAAEGVRIWGSDPYDAAGWEVGQVFFERWWFIFDRAVVEQSNRLRELRGAAALRMQSLPSGPRVGTLT